MSVKVHAPNWMMAMSKAMAFMDIDPDSMGRWVCEPQEAGAVKVKDPASGGVWDVIPVSEDGTAASPPATPATPATPAAAAPTAPVPAAPPAPAPAGTSLRPPEDLAEKLFDLSFDITSQTPNVACSTTLSLINDFVPCEASSVLRGTLNDVALTFVAVNGPVAGDILGRKLPWGTGLVGTCYDLGLSIHTTVDHAEQHLKKVDSDTGFQTKAVLCVPVRNDTGTFGVIQLLNPPGGQFLNWHIEACEQVATTLAGALSTTQDI